MQWRNRLHRDSAKYPQLEALKNMVHQHQAGLVGFSLLQVPLVLLPKPLPAGSCRGWEQGLRTSVGPWAPLGAFQECVHEKDEVLYKFFQSSGLFKGHVAVLQACSPTTRTHSAIGSAALNATTTRNSDWLEPYPFMSSRMFPFDELVWGWNKALAQAPSKVVYIPMFHF